jgi:hypothetical protein
MFVISQAVPQISVDAVTVALVVAIITLIGTLVVTILNATWLETRRQLIKREIEKKALHDALYSEMAWTVSALSDLATRTKKPPTDWKSLNEGVSSITNLAVYNYTRKEPTLFYQLSDAHPIELFYQWMLTIQGEIRATPHRPEAESGEVYVYRKDTLEDHLAWAIADLDIDELKGRLFSPHGIEKDPRDYVDELVFFLRQHGVRIHTQETAAPTESEQEKPKSVWARLRGR